MKKLSFILVILVLLLVGCNNGENTSQDLEDKNESVQASQTSDNSDVTENAGFVFESNGTTIPMHAEAAPILEKLGDTMAYFEAESCAFQGMEKTYTYSGFELHTYEKDGVDYVASIMLLDDTVSTKEGIYLYSSTEDVLTAYGDEYTENMGLYTYELGMSKISFLTENEEVTSIEYTAIIE